MQAIAADAKEMLRSVKPISKHAAVRAFAADHHARLGKVKVLLEKRTNMFSNKLPCFGKFSVL
ncbi:hypothetical protein [Pacificibacter maritimus]|uniref:hypothetical protein n=1 Tax=Pacificibacter maritimus TaxID=762213 RepID=UPI0011CD98C9|nr:hypothetical protein [Pacificibacter maritimus]